MTQIQPEDIFHLYVKEINGYLIYSRFECTEPGCIAIDTADRVLRATRCLTHQGARIQYALCSIFSVI